MDELRILSEDNLMLNKCQCGAILEEGERLCSCCYSLEDTSDNLGIEGGNKVLEDEEDTFYE